MYERCNAEPVLQVECVAQEPADLPRGHAPATGRAKPWGTGHAVLAARHVVSEPFAVANADDFYGRASYAALTEFFGRGAVGAVPSYALVGFPLRGTLSDAGPVNRAICRTDDEGRLEWIEERTGLTPAIVDEQRIGGRLVSMNLWGFTPAVFGQLEAAFEFFLHDRGTDEDAEFLLPSAMQSLVSAGSAQVRVLPSTGGWCGVTYGADAALVSAHLEALTGRGEYPRDLWA